MRAIKKYKPIHLMEFLSELRIRVEESSFLHFEGILLSNRLAELEENLKINMTKPNHI